MSDESLNEHQYQYDVCFSFSGNERGYVHDVANFLKNTGFKVFYDEFAEACLWGKDLYEHFANIYSKSSRYCVIFISKSYSERLWTNHERRNAQERAFRENSEYILPARFDSTEIPGLRDTIGYIDLRKKTPEEFASLIIEKIGYPVKVNYLPSNPNFLFDELDANSSHEEDVIYNIAVQIFESLKMATLEERRLLYDIFLNGCPSGLPENIHINADYIQRLAGYSLEKILMLLSNVECLGFKIHIDDEENENYMSGVMKVITVRWYDHTVDGYGNCTDVLSKMFESLDRLCCPNCSRADLDRLDFSSLELHYDESEFGEDNIC